MNDFELKQLDRCIGDCERACGPDDLAVIVGKMTLRTVCAAARQHLVREQPFQREKDIRSGKLDKEVPGYEEITGWLGRVPMTWLPGLLVSAVKHCLARNVFKDKSALLRVAEKATEENDFLR